jgi:hypothetical protein
LILLLSRVLLCGSRFGFNRLSGRLLIKRGECTGDLHVDLSNDVEVLIHLGCSELASLGDLTHFVVSEADHDILRLKICMDDLAHSVHIVKTDEALASKLSN